MRRAALLLSLVLTTAAQGQELDCTALRSSDVPYRTTYAPAAGGRTASPVLFEDTERRSNGDVLRLRRLPGRADTSTVELRYSFVQRTLDSAGPVSEFRIEGLDLGRDPFGMRRDFSYTREVRNRGAAPFTEQNAARYLGEEMLTVSGCALPVVVYEIERRIAEPSPGQAGFSVDRFWYSPELRGFLRFSGTTPQFYDIVAVRIETGF